MENDNVYSFKRKRKKNGHNSLVNFNGKTDGDKFKMKLWRRKKMNSRNLLTLFTFSGHRLRTHCFFLLLSQNQIKSSLSNYKWLIHSYSWVPMVQNWTFLFKKKKIKIKIVLFVLKICPSPQKILLD